MMRRFSSITLTAMVRCEVASGMETLLDMFSAILPATPRSGWRFAPSDAAAAAGDGAELPGAAEAGVMEGGVVEGGAAPAGGGAPGDWKSWDQDSSTVERSCRY